MKFEELGIRPELIKALEKDEIIEPTRIQQIAIPPILAGKDVIGISNTGSGKTMAFGIPIVNNLKPNEGLQVLILCPTRELAIQIETELRKLSRARVTSVYGGVALEPQIFAMRKADIVVATTGRFVDHLRRENIDMSKVNTVILDEADKMVEMGFIEDIELILSQIRQKKQILLFGATISEEIEGLKKNHMHDVEIVKAKPFVEEDYLEQYYVDLKPHEKFSYLVHLLKKEHTGRTMIFCATRRSVEILANNLKKQGINVAMIHGKLGQATRMKIMEGFNKGKPDILVASAVAARGLDIRNVTHIYNYSLASDPQEYVHRVGRTARAGESGKAITLLENRDHEAFGMILDRYDFKVHKLEKENFKKLAFNAQMADKPRGRFSRGGPRGQSRGGPRRGGPRGSSRSEHSSHRREHEPVVKAPQFGVAGSAH